MFLSGLPHSFIPKSASALRRMALAATLSVAPAVHAANWIDVLAGEPADAPRLRAFGFVQPTWTGIDADPLSGLAGSAAALNGKTQIQNRVGPGFTASSQAQFQRAQFGLRGRLSPDVNYLLLAEAGDNPTTAQRPAALVNVALIDAALTWRGVPGARVRLGLMKRPVGHEAIVSVPRAYPYVYYSSVTAALVQEATYHDVAGLPPGCAASGGAVSLDCARVVSGNNAFRDWGVQLFDSARLGAWEFGYALMWANGGEIENPRDADGNHDLIARLQLSRILQGAGPARYDAQVFIWRQSGERRYGAVDVARVREGAGFQWTRHGARLTGEAIRGRGMVPAGRNPPVVPDGSELRAPYELNIAPNGEARGGYLEAGWRIAGPWEADLRYDVYDRNSDDAAARRRFTTWTLGLQYHWSPSLRLAFNYELRRAEVVQPEAIPDPVARANAIAIADNLGDRSSVQLTWSF